MSFNLNYLYGDGKFSIIWRAANGKLLLKGKGARNDMRLVQKVHVDRICKEMWNYIKIENLPSASDEFKVFPLHFIAKLSYGIVLILNKQVAHTLANARLDFQRKASQKQLKEANISCDVLDLSDAAIVPRTNFDHCSLEEREFGILAEVVGALQISSHRLVSRQVQLCGSPNASHQGDVENCLGEIEINSNQGQISYANSEDITMTEPNYQGLQILHDLDDDFGFGDGDVSEILFEDPPFEQMDINENQGTPNLRRSNSKRLRAKDDSGSEEVPNKHSRSATVGEDMTTDFPATHMILDPVSDSVARGARRRRRRAHLITDVETTIPAAKFAAQMKDCDDILLNIDSTRIITQYQECTVNDIFMRPSREENKGPIRNLVTKHFVSNRMEGEENFDIVEDVRRIAQVIIADQTFGVALTVPEIKITEASVETFPEVDRSPERGRFPQLKDASVANSSNLNFGVGILGIGAGVFDSPVHPNIGIAFDETTESPNLAAALTYQVDVEGPNLDEQAHAVKVTLIETADDQDVMRSVNEAAFNVHESHFLLNMIEQMISRLGTLTFKQLIPPTKYSREEAAKNFSNVIELFKDRKINLYQQVPMPREPIFITLNR